MAYTYTMVGWRIHSAIVYVQLVIGTYNYLKRKLEAKKTLLRRVGPHGSPSPEPSFAKDPKPKQPMHTGPSRI